MRDILVIANALAAAAGEPEPYLVEVAAPGGEQVPLWGGLALSGVRDLATTRVTVDTLVVVGGPVAEQATEDPVLVAGVRRLASRSRRVIGVCTGALILAAAGLLDGKRVTTHWSYGDVLATAHPEVEVDTDPIFITDGRISTSAGVTAGYDLLLALVESDLGADMARAVAEQLVLYLRRTGTQSQFSAALAAQPARRQPVRDVQAYIHENPAAELSLSALADRVHMSPRHFARVFTAELGLSPGRYVERVRLETARQLLADGDDSTEAVARAAGFGNYQALRRAFISALGISPAEYRRRFGSTPDSPDLSLVG